MIHDTLTMIPGPTPVHPRILAALARPTLSHQDPRFVATFRACLDDFRRLVRTESAQPFVIPGSGTLAMEMAQVNLVGAGQRLLVVSHGYFGDRNAEIAEAFGIEHDLLAAEWGRAVAPEALAARLDDADYAAVCITHVDTSSGTAAPLEHYAEVLRGRDALFVLDGVCATAGMDERFDAWGVDLLLTGAQKALGAPPGLALLAVSPRALERRRARGAVPAYYADLLRWLPIMDDPARYFATPAVNTTCAIHEALRLVLEEGLDARFARHARIAGAVRAGLAALGLEPFTEPDCRADTLTVVRHADGVDDAAFREALYGRGVVVAGALGPIAGRAFRIGHMGNIGSGEVCCLLEAVEATLAALGHRVDRGSALAAAAPHLVG